MTPSGLSTEWLRATAALGGSPGAAAAVLSGLGPTPEAWAVFWSAYPAVPARGRRPPRSPRGVAAALVAEQDRAGEAAVAAAVAAAPALGVVVRRSYTPAYWREVYGGPARRAVARRQARYLAAAAAPGWPLDPGWRTSTVLGLAAAIVAAGAYDRVPILADALEEAGCDNAEWLALMRDPDQPWFAGCPVLASLA